MSECDIHTVPHGDGRANRREGAARNSYGNDPPQSKG
jgi:hypothetical protein